MAKRKTYTDIERDFARFVLKYERTLKPMVESVVDSGDPALGRDNALSLMYNCFVGGAEAQASKIARLLKDAIDP